MCGAVAVGIGAASILVLAFFFAPGEQVLLAFDAASTRTARSPDPTAPNMSVSAMAIMQKGKTAQHSLSDNDVHRLGVWRRWRSRHSGQSCVGSAAARCTNARMHCGVGFEAYSARETAPCVCACRAVASASRRAATAQVARSVRFWQGDRRFRPLGQREWEPMLRPADLGAWSGRLQRSLAQPDGQLRRTSVWMYVNVGEGANGSSAGCVGGCGGRGRCDQLLGRCVCRHGFKGVHCDELVPQLCSARMRTLSHPGRRLSPPPPPGRTSPAQRAPRD